MAPSDKDLHSAMCAAARIGDVAAVSRLLDAGAEIDCAKSKRVTPLHHACGHGQADLVSRLLEAGAKVNRALDLDGKAAKASFPGGEGLLDTGSWRLTVGFLVATIGLACFSAATTDFGPGDDVDFPVPSPSEQRVQVGPFSIP